MSTPRHVFVTGAAGFIGGHTVEEFVREGWHVLALIHRRTSPALEDLADQGCATIVRGDVTSCDALMLALKHALGQRAARLDAIVHCAGRASDVGWTRVFRRTNFESVQHLVQMTKDMDVGRLVFVSTTDVYGLRDFSSESEDELPLATRSSNPYPKFKIAAEKWIRSELPPERYAIVRPAAVWGVGDPTLTPRIVAFLRRSPWIVHFGKWRGRNRWPLAHVRNVAAALFLAAAAPGAGGLAINVLDSERTTIDEFYRLLAGVFLPSKEFRTVTLPLWLSVPFAGAVSALSNLLNLEHPFADPSLYALRSVSSDLDFSNHRFAQLLSEAGRCMVTREEGVREFRDGVAERSLLREGHLPARGRLAPRTPRSRD